MKEREFNKLSHTIYKCIYHVVFCPKYRKKILQDDIAEYIKQLKFHRFLRKFKDHTNYLSKKSPIGMKIEFQFSCQYLLLFH